MNIHGLYVIYIELFFLGQIFHCISILLNKNFFDMLSGKLTRIVVHVDLQPIADELHGDYINDKSFKRHFQQWLNSLWQEKDRLLTSLMSSQRQNK